MYIVASNPQLNYVIVDDNQTNYEGGAFYCSNGAVIDIIHSNITNNSSIFIGGGSQGCSFTLENSIVYNNSIPGVTATYSLYASDAGNNGNIGGNSLLNNDYTLQPTSPCIDAGDPNSPLDPDGTRADMGAYPYDQIANPLITGCQETEACNYDSTANIPGECTYVDGICETCLEGVIIDNDSDNDTICDVDEVSGCQDLEACNYDGSATDSGECFYIDGICETCEDGIIVDNDSDDDTICDSLDLCIGIYDECGVCNGDNSSCTGLLSLGVIDAACNTELCSGTLEILYDFPGPVAGFQFDISNINISDTNGGISDLFTISSSNNTVIGFSFSGQQILMGSGILLILEFDNILGDTTSIDESSVILSYPGGDQEYLAGVQGNSIIHPMDCTNSYYGEVLEGCDNICGSGHINDCTGICISPEQNISGDGIFNDCNGICGGDSYLDCAGICDNNINNDLGHDYDQDGICDEIDICPGFEYYNFSGDLVCLDAEQPYELLLKQNYPNPFNPYTNIEFYLDFNDYIELNIYDIKGRKVKTLLSEFSLSGSHLVKWDGKNKNGDDLPSGIYLYQLVNSQNILSKKMILLR